MAKKPTAVANPRIAKLIELETTGRIKPEHQQELEVYRAQGVAPANNKPQTREGEDKASAFIRRALGANVSYEKTGVGPRSLVGQTLANTAPDLLNALPATVGNSPQRQVADSAQDEFIAASLRQDSGAAIPEEELERQRRIYFPMPNEGPEAVAQKRAARLRAIAGLEASAGRALTPETKAILDGFRPDIDKALRGEALDDAAPIAKEANTLTISNLTDFASGLSGGKYEVTETGLSYNGEPINASPDILNSDEYAAAYRAKFGTEPALSVNITEEAPAAIDLRRDTTMGAVDAAVRGAADTITLGAADELAAAGRTIFSDGTMRDNLRAERAIDSSDERVNPLARFAGQAGGALLPWGRVLGRGGPAVPRSALRSGGEGAALGGTYAFNSGEGGFTDRLAQVPTGAALGGALGAGFGALSNRLRNRPNGAPPPRGTDESVEIAKAAAEENIPVSRPVVDPRRRDAMAYLESSIGGGGPVRQALKGTADALEARAGGLGNGGMAQEGGVIGQRIQDAGERYIEKSRGVGGRMYDRADQMAGGTPVTGRDAVQVLDKQIAELQGNANTNSPLIKYLQEIRGDFVDEGGNLKAKTIGDIRDLRTQLRGNINNRNLTATDAERRVGMVLDAAKTDIQRDLGKTAPAAVRQYDRADKFWRERKAEIDQVVRRVIGNKNDKLGGEAVWSRIKTMASEGGDSQRLDRLWQKLEPEEQADAAATIAARLGRRSPEEDFSPALFVSSVRALSPAARRTIFGPEGAKSITNLRAVAEAYRDTAARLNNSRSGVVMNWGSEIRNLVTRGGIGGAVGATVGGVPGAVVGTALGTAGGAGLRHLSARALMSPDMSKWLRQAPRMTTPQKIERHVARLRTVATRDPAIAQDALGLQRYLQQALSSTPTRAAADEERQ
jgi:hypothetical protein